MAFGTEFAFCCFLFLVLVKLTNKQTAKHAAVVAWLRLALYDWRYTTYDNAKVHWFLHFVVILFVLERCPQWITQRENGFFPAFLCFFPVVRIGNNAELLAWPFVLVSLSVLHSAQSLSIPPFTAFGQICMCPTSTGTVCIFLYVSASQVDFHNYSIEHCFYSITCYLSYCHCCNMANTTKLMLALEYVVGSTFFLCSCFCSK